MYGRVYDDGKVLAAGDHMRMHGSLLGPQLAKGESVENGLEPLAI